MKANSKSQSRHPKRIRNSKLEYGNNDRDVIAAIRIEGVAAG